MGYLCRVRRRVVVPTMAQPREPSEEAISDFVSIAGLQREQAVKWLKVWDIIFGVIHPDSITE